MATRGRLAEVVPGNLVIQMYKSNAIHPANRSDKKHLKAAQTMFEERSGSALVQSRLKRYREDFLSDDAIYLRADLVVSALSR